MESAENREQPIKVNQQAEELLDSPPLSKVETLKLLNDSIDKLEETIKSISESSSADLPSSASINDLLATTQELADTVTPTSDSDLTSKPVPETMTDSAAEKTQSPIPATPINATPTVQAPKTKTVVSKPKQNKTVLISIAVFAIAMAVVAIFWLWLPQRQASLDSLSQTPAAEILAENENISIPETINTPQSEPVDITADSTSSNSESANSELDVPVEVSIPQDLVAPGRAKNLKIVTIEPELKFTPEQNLIAALQTKIANITEGYPTDCVDSIQVNLVESSILVKVNEDWYELNESRQNKIANAILDRSRKLKFSQLNFQDSTGTLVARNPVVGDDMIILESSKDSY